MVSGSGREHAEAPRGLAERSRALLETMRSFADGTDDYPRLLESIARRLTEVIGDAAMVMLVSPHDPLVLVPAAVQSESDETTRRMRALLASSPTRLDAHPAVARVLASGVSWMASKITPETVAHETSPAYLEFGERTGIHSVLVVPLRLHGVPLGIVSLSRSLPTSPSFDEHDRIFAETLAVHASLAISNARLLAERNDAEARSTQLRAQHDSDRMFRELLEAAPDAMVIVDEAGQISVVNGQAERLFGYTRAELVGSRIEMLVPERARAGHPAHRADFFREPSVRPMGADLQLTGSRKDGTEFPAEISLAPMRTDGGLLVTAAIRDVTERKRNERALKLANRELEAFSYSVAHDLRAPLRAMNGFARVLLDEHASKLDAEGRDWLEEIVLNAKKMAELIDAMLALSRVTRAELKPTNVSLSKKARTVADQLAIAEPGRAVEVVIHPDLFARVDPGLARALLQNLIGNAWKFTRDTAAPRIEVGAEVVDGSPAFFVRDNGAGFDMAYASKLFAPFQRLHTVAEFAGTGVGLATVQRIVHRHGGRVWADARVGEGAVFHFTLPRPSTEDSPP